MSKVRVVFRCPLCGLNANAERLKRGWGFLVRVYHVVIRRGIKGLWTVKQEVSEVQGGELLVENVRVGLVARLRELLKELGGEDDLWRRESLVEELVESLGAHTSMSRDGSASATSASPSRSVPPTRYTSRSIGTVALPTSSRLSTVSRIK